MYVLQCQTIYRVLSNARMLRVAASGLQASGAITRMPLTRSRTRISIHCKGYVDSGPHAVFRVTADNTQELEDHLRKVPDFNVVAAPRRAWQSGDSKFGNLVFWMKVPMFLRVAEGARKPPFSEHLHAWVREAAGRSRRYYGNPQRPTVRAIEGGRLRNIAQCSPSRLRHGDGVAVTFTVQYVEGKVDWYPQYTLIDIVRVICSPDPERTSSGVYVSVTSGAVQRNALQDGEIVDGEAVTVGVRHVAMLNLTLL